MRGRQHRVTLTPRQGRMLVLNITGTLHSWPECWIGRKEDKQSCLSSFPSHPWRCFSFHLHNLLTLVRYLATLAGPCILLCLRSFLGGREGHVPDMQSPRDQALQNLVPRGSGQGRGSKTGTMQQAVDFPRVGVTRTLNKPQTPSVKGMNSPSPEPNFLENGMLTKPHICCRDEIFSVCTTRSPLLAHALYSSLPIIPTLIRGWRECFGQ